jgi:hypothetical protein
VFILGHSHTICVRHAAERPGRSIPILNLWDAQDSFEGELGSYRVSDELKQRLRGPVVSMIGGGSQHVLGHTLHPSPFDFVLPDAPGLPMVEGATLLTLDAVLATLSQLRMVEVEMLQAVAKAAEGPVFHLQPPPPRREELNWDDPMWRTRAANTDVVSPATFRMKVSGAHTLLLQRECAAAGVTLVPPPSEAVDDEGYLKEEFAGWPCHGNVEYGELILAQLEAIIA